MLSTSVPPAPASDAATLQAALAQAERRLAEVQALVGVGMWEYNRTSGELWWSEEMFRLLGLEPRTSASHELLVRGTHPDDVARAIDLCAATERGEMHDVVFRVRHASGDVRVLRCITHAHVIERAGAPEQLVAGSMLDITERTATEAALRDSAEQLELAIELTELGIFEHDLEEHVSRLSPILARMHGRPSLEVTEAELLERVHPDDRALLIDEMRQLNERGSVAMRSMTHRLVRPDGEVRWVHLRARRREEQRAGRGTTTKVVGVARDITLERALTDSLELKHRAIEHALTPIAITNAAGRIEYVNAMFLQAWGYASADEVLGREPREFARPSSAAPPLSTLVHADSYQGEFLARRADGSTFAVLASVSGMRDARGELTHLMTSFLDLSEIKQLHQELLHAQRLESMGRLAGGIAHDFNNLLSVISSVTDLVLDALPTTDAHAADLLQVRAATQSARELTRQLLSFSRKQPVHVQPIDTNALLQHVGRLLERLLGASVQVQLELGEQVPSVAFDRTLAEQMLINLGVNARDAMPDGGTLTLGTEVVSAPSNWPLEQAGAPEHPWVLISVRDTGVGMSQDVKAHAFEPFYTTKEPGRGTGLGLSMVFGTVTQHGGHIEIDSAEWVGTTFRLYLPALSDLRAA